MACLFLLVIRFSLHVPCDVFTITNEDNHVETDQTNLANDQLAKQNASGIHDIFYQLISNIINPTIVTYIIHYYFFKPACRIT